MVCPVGMRPFHDLRVTAITNDAIAGANPVALVTKAGARQHGHDEAVSATRWRRLREEADALEQRFWADFLPHLLPT
jgi:hypothetical protein